MQAFEYIDLYCERTGPAFWNEPLNAISNIAFPLAAAFAWRQLSQRGGADRLEYLAVILAGLIGVGSFLFHTFAQPWSEYADIIPIWSFVALFVVLCVYRTTGQDLIRTLRIVLIASVVTLSVAWFTSSDLTTETARTPPILNGSLQYLPAIIALLVFTAIAWLRKLPVRHHLLIATGVFSLALFFRTVDLLACDTTHGIGTHFLWHVFNGVFVGVLLLGAVHKMPPLARHTDR